MKRFLLQLSAFLLIQASLWFALVIVYFHYSFTGVDYQAATIDKHNLLDKQLSPRIIFIGGSNLSRGLDSAEVQQALGFNPVNMGLNMDLGLDFMLNEVKGSVRKDDIIVISPEYEHFERGRLGSSSGALFKILCERPESALSLTASNLSTLLDEGLILMGDVTRFSLRTIAGGAKPKFPIYSPGVYSRKSFNIWGDDIFHYSGPIQIPTFQLELKPSSSSIERTIHRLNLFDSFCTGRGVAVYYSFPPLYQDGYEHNKKVIQRIESSLRARLIFPLLNTPEQMVFPLEDVHDNYYHLTLIGTHLRTQHVIKELRGQGVGTTRKLADEMHVHS